MYQICVVSGKGGVGKTSITASLAWYFSQQQQRLVVGDADVDAPNIALLFDQHANSLEEFHVQTTFKAQLDRNLCVHCKICITEEFCSFDALSWDEADQIPVIDGIACEGCNGCKILCPSHAFSTLPINSGTIKRVQTENGFEVITGETILGAQTSGKLVTELKQYTVKTAKAQQIDLIIYDGPPGIGCPVIATLSDINYALVVVEPTMAALHDAKRVIEVIQKFNVPFGIVINKADMNLMNYSKVRAYLEAEGYVYLGDIPWDIEWAEAVANHRLLIADRPMGKSAVAIGQIGKKLVDKIREKNPHQEE